MVTTEWSLKRDKTQILHICLSMCMSMTLQRAWLIICVFFLLSGEWKHSLLIHQAVIIERRPWSRRNCNSRVQILEDGSPISSALKRVYGQNRKSSAAEMQMRAVPGRIETVKVATARTKRITRNTEMEDAAFDCALNFRDKHAHKPSRTYALELICRLRAINKIIIVLIKLLRWEFSGLVHRSGDRAKGSMWSP